MARKQQKRYIVVNKDELFDDSFDSELENHLGQYSKGDEEQEEGPGLLGGAWNAIKAVGEGAPLVAEGIYRSGKDIIYGFDPQDTETNEAREDYKRRLREYEESYKGLGGAAESVAKAAESSGTSLAGTLVGIPAGIAAGILSANPVVGYAAMGATSAAAAGRADYVEQMVQLYKYMRDKLNGGKDLDPEHWQRILDHPDISKALLQHAGIETGGEMIADTASAAAMGALAGPFGALLGRPAGKILGKGIARGIMGLGARVGGSVATELGTETVQEKLQSEVEAPLYNRKALTWGESWNEIFGQTVAQTLIFDALFFGFGHLGGGKKRQSDTDTQEGSADTQEAGGGTGTPPNGAGQQDNTGTQGGQEGTTEQEGSQGGQEGNEYMRGPRGDEEAWAENDNVFAAVTRGGRLRKNSDGSYSMVMPNGKAYPLPDEIGAMFEEFEAQGMSYQQIAHKLAEAKKAYEAWKQSRQQQQQQQQEGQEEGFTSAEAEGQDTGTQETAQAQEDVVDVEPTPVQPESGPAATDRLGLGSPAPQPQEQPTGAPRDPVTGEVDMLGGAQPQFPASIQNAQDTATAEEPRGLQGGQTQPAPVPTPSPAQINEQPTADIQEQPVAGLRNELPPAVQERPQDATGGMLDQIPPVQPDNAQMPPAVQGEQAQEQEEGGLEPLAPFDEKAAEEKFRREIEEERAAREKAQEARRKETEKDEVQKPEQGKGRGPRRPILVGYEWISKDGEKYSRREEGLVPAKISDWERKKISAGSGREIVHIYYIKDEDGVIRPYGKESAKKKLGLAFDTALSERAKLAARDYKNMSERLQQFKEWIKDGKADRKRDSSPVSSDPSQVMQMAKSHVRREKGTLSENCIFTKIDDNHYAVFFCGSQGYPSRYVLTDFLEDNGVEIVERKVMSETVKAQEAEGIKQAMQGRYGTVDNPNIENISYEIDNVEGGVDAVYETVRKLLNGKPEDMDRIEDIAWKAMSLAGQRIKERQDAMIPPVKELIVGNGKRRVTIVQGYTDVKPIAGKEYLNIKDDDFDGHLRKAATDAKEDNTPYIVYKQENSLARSYWIWSNDRANADYAGFRYVDSTCYVVFPDGSVFNAKITEIGDSNGRSGKSDEGRASVGDDNKGLGRDKEGEHRNDEGEQPVDASSVQRTVSGEGSEKSNDGSGTEPNEGRRDESKRIGNAVNIKIKGRDDLAARWEIMESGDVQPSHLPLNGYEVNPKNKVGNERRYHAEGASQKKVDENARNLDAAFLFESVDANHGAPIVDHEGNTLGGNGRAMSIQVAYEKYPERGKAYKAQLAERAESFGLTSEAVMEMDRPMLVRRTTGNLSLEERRKLMSSMNQTYTDSLVQRSESVSRGSRFTKRVLRALAAGMSEADSLRDYFDKAASRAVVEMMLDDGIISSTERNIFLNDEGLLNPNGKTVIEKALTARLFGDTGYDDASVTPEVILAKVSAVIPGILDTEITGGEWNLKSAVTEALSLVAEFANAQGSSRQMKVFLEQINMLTGKARIDTASKEAVAIFKSLINENKAEFVSRIERYTSLMRQSDTNQSTFFAPVTRDEAFQKAFLGEPPKTEEDERRKREKDKMAELEKRREEMAAQKKADKKKQEKEEHLLGEDDHEDETLAEYKDGGKIVVGREAKNAAQSKLGRFLRDNGKDKNYQKDLDDVIQSATERSKKLDVPTVIYSFKGKKPALEKRDIRDEGVRDIITEYSRDFLVAYPDGTLFQARYIDAKESGIRSAVSTSSVEGGRHGEGVSAEWLREFADDVAQETPGAARVEVVQDFEELPERYQEHFRQKGVRPDRVEGFYAADEGVVYMVAGNLSEERVASVWMHEQVGHNGLRAVLGEKGRKQLLNRLYEMLGGKGNEELAALAEDYHLDLDTEEGRQEAVEELVAHRAEREDLDAADEKLWRRIWRHIAETLRKWWLKATSKLPGKYGKAQKIQLGEMEIKQILRSSKLHVQEGGTRATERGGGVRGSFIGEKGAAALDAAENVTMRMDDLAVARDMEKAGKEAHTIKLATGWEKGKEGKWKYDVPDWGMDVAGAIQRTEAKKYKPLHDLERKETELEIKIANLNHKLDTPIYNNEGKKEFEKLREERSRALKELKKIKREIRDILDTDANERLQRKDKLAMTLGDVYFPTNEVIKAYPHFAKIPVVLEHRESSSYGYYDGKKIVLNIDKNDYALRETLVHEVQHTIQEEEGFARGGNPGEFEDQYFEDVARIRTARKIQQLVDQGQQDGKPITYIKAAWEIFDAQIDPKITDAAKYFIQSADTTGQVQWYYNMGQQRVKDPFESYQALAGEVEARNATKRLKMGSEERRNSLASETEDIPRNEQILRFYENDDLSDLTAEDRAFVEENGMSKEDRDYFHALNDGDMDAVRKMVEQKAKENGFENAIPEQNGTFKVRTRPAPKKTIKVYKVFTLAPDGSPTALFIGGDEKLPVGVWLDAVDAYHFTAGNGLEYVPSTQNPYTEGGKTGQSVAIPNDKVRQELIRRGFLSEGSKANKITALAYRPGWHAGTQPFFPQGGKKQEGVPYNMLHRHNQVVFECEIVADHDYTAEAQSQEKALTKGGTVNARKADFQEMKQDGFYYYATNPKTQANPNLGAWVIGGSLKINRAMTQEECDAILRENNLEPQQWEGGKLNLASLGYTGERNDAARKTLAPVTYDKNGNIIPLSLRFQKNNPDVLASVAGDRFREFRRDPKEFLRKVKKDMQGLSAQNQKDISWNDSPIPWVLGRKFPIVEKVLDIQRGREDKRLSAYIDAIRGMDEFADMRRNDKEAYKYVKDIIFMLDGNASFKLTEPMFIKDPATNMYTGLNPKHYDELKNMLLSSVNNAAFTGKAAFGRAVDLYIKMRESLDKDLLAIIDRIQSIAPYNDIEKLRNRVGSIPFYFPHVRFGEYYIKVTDKATGDTVYRQHFDAVTEATAATKAAAMRSELERKYSTAKHDIEFGRNLEMPNDVFDKALSTTNIEAILLDALDELKKNGKMAGKDLKSVRSAMLKEIADVLREHGFGQHLMRRQNIEGYEQDDIYRVLVAYKSGLYGWLTKMDASKDFGDALADFVANNDIKETPKLYTWLRTFIQNMLRNVDKVDERVSKAKTFFFLNYLGGSIKTAAINATQNLVIGLPVLGREIGVGRAYIRYFSDAGRAIADQVKYWGGKGNHSKLLSSDEVAFLDDFYNSSQMRRTLFEELMGADDSRLTKGFQHIVKVLGLPMSMVERFNRTSLALAAYRAARDGKVTYKKTLARYGEKPGNKWDDAKARKFARDVVDEAHFVYGKGNLPQFLRNSATGRYANIFYTFRSFSLNMWSWICRNLLPKKFFGGGENGWRGRAMVLHSILSTWALGGLMAVPLYKTTSLMLRQLLGKDHEDDWEKYAKKHKLNDALDTLMYGIPSLANVSLEGSLNLELPFVSKLKAGTPWMGQVLDSFAENAMGVAYSTLKKGNNFWKLVKSEQYMRAAEEVAPTFLSNIMKAERLYNEGSYTPSGKPIGKDGPAKLSNAERIGLWMGFQPVSRAKDWREKQRTEDMKQRTSSKRSEIVTEYTLARRILASKATPAEKRNARKKINSIRKEVIKWNEKNPSYPIGKEGQEMEEIAKLSKQRDTPVK